ncbi:MAG TPA: hypothetical protein VJH63_01580 [Candidatus Paceibacterota bacterium]
MKKFLESVFRFKSILALSSLIAVVGFASFASASHSWGSYHWARTSNPFTIKVGNNLTSVWQTSLTTASSDWSASTVIDTAIVPGLKNPRTCKPTLGRIEACNSKYGNNGWLGIAQIWTYGSHIAQAVVKLNDTYFNTTKYNKSSWRQLVMCQEIAHDFGLDHQDSIFTNPNLGTCMDYTNDPTGTAGTNGTLNNEHPNQHDFDQLVTIYTHLDATNTSFSTTANSSAGNSGDMSERSEWGKEIRKSENGRHSLFERDLGNGKKVHTFVTWAD